MPRLQYYIYGLSLLVVIVIVVHLAKVSMPGAEDISSTTYVLRQSEKNGTTENHSTTSHQPPQHPKLPSAPRRLDPEIFLFENSTDEKYKHSHAALYSTISQPESLCDDETFLVVVVMTKPRSFQLREVYRTTVLSPITSGCLTDTKYLFLIGKSASEELQHLLNEESQRYGDILQGNFTDSYNTLTIKSLFLLQWSMLNCPRAKYIFKLDDDVFTIIEDIRFYLKFDKFSDHAIAGSIFKNVKPIRDTKNKWHVKNFKGAVFPQYVSGTAYILSYTILGNLFNCGVNIPFVRLEDVFITGIAAEATKLNIQYYDLPGFHYKDGGVNLAKTDFHIHKSIHSVDSIQIRFLQEKMLKERALDCDI